MRLRRALRTLLAGALLSLPLGGMAPGLPASVACAATTERAVLVVDTGSSEMSFCVAIPSGGTSGIGLIKLAHEQHGLDYSLGFGGNAVCKLAGVGVDGDDCWADYPDFWGYWHQSASGSWTWASSGASSYTVHPGDVEGWSWGSGQDGSTHQQPPRVAYGARVPQGRRRADGPRAMTTSPPKSLPRWDRPIPRQPPERTEPTGLGDENNNKGSGGKKKDDRELPPSEVETPAPERSPVAAPVSASGAPNEPGGPPPVGLIGLGVAASLGAAGVVISKRRAGAA